VAGLKPAHVAQREKAEASLKKVPKFEVHIEADKEAHTARRNEHV